LNFSRSKPFLSSADTAAVNDFLSLAIAYLER
jgi:hypothetical protein